MLEKVQIIRETVRHHVKLHNRIAPITDDGVGDASLKRAICSIPKTNTLPGLLRQSLSNSCH